MNEPRVVRPTRAEAACALVIAGASYEEVATVLGFKDDKEAMRAVEGSLAKSASAHDKMQLRELASRRYERLLRAVWGKALDPNCGEQMVAVRTARELIDRHVALQGLAVPQEVVVRTPTTQELEQWVAQMSRISMPELPEADVLGIEGAIDVEYEEVPPEATTA